MWPSLHISSFRIFDCPFGEPVGYPVEPTEDLRVEVREGESGYSFAELRERHSAGNNWVRCSSGPIQGKERPSDRWCVLGGHRPSNGVAGGFVRSSDTNGF